MIRLRFVLAAILAVSLSGCVGSGDEESEAGAQPDSEISFISMLANYADALIIPGYLEFSQVSADLSEGAGTLENYCAAIGSDGEAEALAAAQADWLHVMSVWQTVEVLNVGPAADNGAALRNRIYSYGSTSKLSTCAVDQSVVLAQSDGFTIASRSFNSRGLDALEYLLFNSDLTHTCPSQISETANWNSLAEAERKAARCQYANLVATDISAAANALYRAWAQDEGNYRFRFVSPENQQASFEALSDALFYIETETKDAKLGVPTGIHSNCSQLACPETVESKYSESSLANIRKNLEAFRSAFNGGDGIGFDDIIVNQGFPEVAAQFNTMVADALSLIDTMDTSLYDQTTALLASGSDSACINSAANPDTVQALPACSLHGLLKRITDALRTDFVAIVDIDLPDRSQSDND